MGGSTGGRFSRHRPNQMPGDCSRGETVDAAGLSSAVAETCRFESCREHSQGGGVWYLAGLISRRPRVRIPSLLLALTWRRARSLD